MVCDGYFENEAVDPVEAGDWLELDGSDGDWALSRAKADFLSSLWNNRKLNIFICRRWCVRDDRVCRCAEVMSGRWGCGRTR
jgi:hypothetical protein